MVERILTPTAMADWLDLLDRVESSLARALDETARQEQVLGTADVAPAADGAAAAERRCLGQIDERLLGLGKHLEAAVRLATAVEALLDADGEEARSWVARSDRAKGRLAEPTAGGVS